MPWDHLQSGKEIIRHVLHSTGLGSVMSAVRRRRGFVVDHLNAENPAERFRAVYRLGAWVHSKDQASASGAGSEAAATEAVVEELPPLLKQLDAKVVLDIGCGDWNWMRRMTLPCQYVGIDIVPEVIEANRAYARDGVSFEVADAIIGPLPTADVALCREILFHMSFHAALAVLANIRRSAHWLVATTDERIWFNSNIPTGDFRLLNLRRPPFNLPPPRFSIADDAVSRDRLLGVWPTSDLP